MSEYNESDYSDFLYLASPKFLPLDSKPKDKRAASDIKMTRVRLTETCNTCTTPPPVAHAGGLRVEKEYSRATFPPSRQKTPAPGEESKTAERHERRPSFVEVTLVKVHHEYDNTKAAHGEKRHSHSSHNSEPMNWWPEDETKAQHDWTDEEAEEKDINEEEVWSDAFYE